VDTSPAKITASKARPPASQLASTLGRYRCILDGFGGCLSKMKDESGSAERVRAHQDAHPTE